jgi:hypothetical protein
VSRHNRQVPKAAHAPGSREVNAAGKITSADDEGRKAGSKVPAWKRKAKRRRK